MRVLRSVFRLKHTRLSRIIFLAVAPADERRGGGRGFVRQSHRVGTHIGNQAGRPDPFHIDALVKLLRNAHRAARGHVQLARRFLLKRRGNKRRRHRFLFLPALNAANRKLVACNGSSHRHCLLLGFELRLSVLPAVVTGGKFAALRSHQLRVDRPVFLRHKGADLLLPVNHKAGRNRLHAPSGQPALDLAPKKRRQAVTHNAVQDPARLLRVNQVNINIARVVNPIADGIFRNLIEGYTLGIGIFQLKQFFDVPGNGLPLAVRVGCEKYEIARLRRLAQLGNQLVLALDWDVFGRKIVFQINPHRLAGQIAQMAH